MPGRSTPSFSFCAALLFPIAAACREPLAHEDGLKESSVVAQAASAPKTITLPGGEGGIGFDDLRYSAKLGRVLVPAGRTGSLDLVDPATGAVTAIKGFGEKESYTSGHGDGTTSVDEGAGFLFAIDRTAMKVSVVDPAKGAILASAAVAATPDYVRYIAATHELWVTQPDAEQVEVFSLSASTPPVPEHAAFIEVKGGPESMVVDERRGRAYTHLWKGATLALDLKTRSIVAHWGNGCTVARGIALDEQRGFLFVGCGEGRAVVLDVEHEGKELGSAATGDGVDIIAYDPARGHLYFPAAKSATLTILGVSAKGELAVLGTLPIAKGAHSATHDGNGRVFVGDPSGGRLLVLADDYPAAGR